MLALLKKVSIEKSGTMLIRVTDNGEGMLARRSEGLRWSGMQPAT